MQIEGKWTQPCNQDSIYGPAVSRETYSELLGGDSVSELLYTEHCFHAEDKFRYILYNPEVPKTIRVV